MKKIYVIILAISVFAVSCSSPYYPEYVDVISLGAETNSLICENNEDDVELSVISNVEYTATIVSGSEWLKFKDSDAISIENKGNSFLHFHHYQNNNVKRLARLVLSAGSRRDTIKIKQKGRFEEHLSIHPDEQSRFMENNETRLPVAWDGGRITLRLKTSCLDYQLSAWSSDSKIVNNFVFDNSAVSFDVSSNDEQQPRIVTIQLSYVDGWEDTKVFEFTIRQDYNPNLANEEDSEE